MAELQRVMQIIDQNSNVLPEGDYLEVCNLLKKSYDTRTDPMYLFMKTFEYHMLHHQARFIIFMIIISIQL